MAVSPATCQFETYGIRLTCTCGAQQYYGGVDAHIYICTSCHAHYKLAQTQEGLKVEEVDK